MLNIQLSVECRHLATRGIQTFGYAWSADIWLCVECRHSAIHGVQTFGNTWSADIRLCVECRHLAMRVVQTFGYVWSADTRVPLHGGMKCVHGESCRQHRVLKTSIPFDSVVQSDQPPWKPVERTNEITVFKQQFRPVSYTHLTLPTRRTV